MQVPAEGHERIGREHPAQRAMPEQRHDPAVVRDRSAGMRARQRESSAREDDDRDQRNQREDPEGRSKSEMVDRESCEQGSDEARHRIAEREQAEVPGTRGGAADLARRVLGGELERHEADAEQRRSDEKRGKAGEDDR